MDRAAYHHAYYLKHRTLQQRRPAKHGSGMACYHKRIDPCDECRQWRKDYRATHREERARAWMNLGPTYFSWHAMRVRCLNENHEHYGYYGGRGITVCERWNDYKNFVADLGERPAGMTLDRIDPNGNYEPGNVRWATAKVQQNNKRRRKHRTSATSESQTEPSQVRARAQGRLTDGARGRPR